MNNYGKKKVPVREKPTQYKGSLFTIHNPYPPAILKQRYWEGNYYKFISIDPAIENFGFRVELRYRNGDIVGEELFRAQFTGVDVTNGKTKKVNVDKETLENIVIAECTEFLDDFDHHYDDTHFILVEQQMIENWYSTRIMQHVLTYFILMFRDGRRGKLPIIAEVHSKLKGNQLGYNKRLGLTLKEWAVLRADELLRVRKDFFSLNMLNKAGKKKDDMSDVVIMIEAFCRYLDIPPFTKDKYTHEGQKPIGFGITDSTENALFATNLYPFRSDGLTKISTTLDKNLTPKKVRIMVKAKNQSHHKHKHHEKEEETIAEHAGTMIGAAGGSALGAAVAAAVMPALVAPATVAGGAIGAKVGEAIGSNTPTILDKTGDYCEEYVPEIGDDINDVLDKLAHELGKPSSIAK